MGLVALGPADETVGLDWDDDGRNPCEFARFGIDPARQGQGLGRRALAAMLQCAREQGYDCVHILVHAAYDHARRLYAHAGFREVCVRHLWEQDYILCALPL